MTLFLRQRIYFANLIKRPQYRRLFCLAFVFIVIAHMLVGIVTVRISSQQRNAKQAAENTREGAKTLEKDGKASDKKENQPPVFQIPSMNGKFILTKFGILPYREMRDGRLDLGVEPDWPKADFVLDFFADNAKSFAKYQILTVNNATNGKPVSAEAVAKQNWRQICPIVPPDLQGAVSSKYNDTNPPTFSQTAKTNPEVLPGGSYAPKHCQSRGRVAIIIPLRGRMTQLRLLMAHMHPIWQRQQLDYTVYTITQESNGQLFNKGKLMNAGFLEATKDREYDCYIFHDVDMTLEDDRCLYHCPKTKDPREISYFLDKFEYKRKTYPLHCSPVSFGRYRHVQYFGGVTQVSKTTFYDVNGYSNFFWGWGGEDDDMFLRLWHKGYAVKNPYDEMCSFHMMKHETESSNSKNEGRYGMLRHAVSRMKYEGLKTLRYRILSVEKNPLYTNITVDVGQPMEKITTFMTLERATWEERCDPKMPWE